MEPRFSSAILLSVGVLGLTFGLLLLASRPPSMSSTTPSDPQAAPTPIPIPFPLTPPDVRLITVSEPDADGYAIVTGAPGAVGPPSAVAVVNLSAQMPMTATADASGAFSATLYAPPGSSLHIRYDPVGDRVKRFWQEALAYEANRVVEYMNPLPGTTLYVGAPPPGDGVEQAFHSVGQLLSPLGTGWTGRWLSGVIEVPAGNAPTGLHVGQGDTVTVTMHLRLY